MRTKFGINTDKSLVLFILQLAHTESQNVAQQRYIQNVTVVEHIHVKRMFVLLSVNRMNICNVFR